MLRGGGHTNWAATYAIVEFAINMTEDGEYRLAASYRESRKTIAGVTYKGDVEGISLVLLRSFLTRISLFHFSVSKLSVGITKC